MASLNKGSVLIEIIIATALMALIAPTIINGLITTRQGEPKQDSRQTALTILKETQESLRIIREKSWSSFSTNGIYYPKIDANTWTLLSGTETIGNFTRSIVISDVFRDISGNINVSGTIDPSTKKITIDVNWLLPSVGNINSIFYFTRYLDNIAYTETNFSQFNNGIKTAVTINHTNNDPTDGDITLGGGGHGDWCKPNLSIYGFNLNHNANGRAITTIENKAFIVTGQNNNSETFYDVNISNTNPPIATSAGNTTGQKKAYSVYGDTIYAYYATDTKLEQGTIINLTNYQEIGYLNLQQNNVRGKSIFVINNLAYLSGSDNKIYIFDISVKSGTHTPIASSVSLNGTANKIIVVGSNIYAAIDATSNQLVILPLTNNGKSISSPIYISVPGQNGRDIFVKDDASRVYLATTTSSNQNELFIINTDPNSDKYKSIINSYDTSGMDPYGITVVTNNKAIIVGVGGIEYQVVDIANDVISSCSTTLGDFNFNIYGIASIIEQDGDAYSYIITSDINSEFKIIEGGPSGKVGKSGSFESGIFDAGYSTAFNRLFYNVNVPTGTSLKFQISSANPVNNNCNGSSYIYRDLDTSGTIPLDSDGQGFENPARCFRYKILFDSNSAGTTPIVYSVTVNMSP